MKIIEMPAFVEWLANLKDKSIQLRINIKIKKIKKDGLHGDIKPIGESASEIRFHFGAGYRVYFLQHGEELIFLLGGSEKKDQQKSIDEAKELARKIKTKGVTYE